MEFVRRIGIDPKIRGDSTDKDDCPDIWELDSGDFAVIGDDMTSELAQSLPPTARKPSASASSSSRARRWSPPSQTSRRVDPPMRPRFPAPAEMVERRLRRPEYKAMFRQASANVRQRVVKVETRQVYREDDDRGLRAYQAGDLEAMYEVMAARKPRYTESMRDYTDHGIEFRRLRLIERPLTD